MKRLLIVTALIEFGGALAFLGFPSTMVRLLLGAPHLAPVAVEIIRVIGVALCVFGTVAWLALRDEQSHTVRSFVKVMAVYNIGVMIACGIVGVWLQPAGIALELTVILHAAMSIWCVTKILTTTVQPAHRAIGQPPQGH